MNGFIEEGDGDFCTREVLHAAGFGCSRCAGLPANFIVVGQCPQFHAIGAGAFSQSLGREGTVRNRGMAVEISVLKGSHLPILGGAQTRAVKLHVDTTHGMGKAQRASVEQQALCHCNDVWRCIQRITQNGVPYGLEVHSKLVGTSGQRLQQDGAGIAQWVKTAKL